MTVPAVPVNIDPGWFRTVLGQYPTGVCIVTAIGPDGAPVGMTVGSFTSVSLEPPMVAFLPMASSSSWAKIEQVGRFCVNILAADQESLCRVFASRNPDKFDEVNWRPGPYGAPILDGAVAWIECDLEAVHEAGDHVIVVGRVRVLEVQRPALPLLFFRGGYGRFSPLSLVAHDRRFGRQLNLVERARPLMEEFAGRIGAQVLVTHGNGVVQTTLASVGTPRDPGSGSFEIGQRTHVTPPIGIWSMAYAEPDVVKAWLSVLESAELAERYRTALQLVRKSGYNLGLLSVWQRVQALVAEREHPHDDPPDIERDRVKEFVVDPMSYVPSRLPADATPESQPDVISLWAPTFAADGQVDLGLAVIGFARDSTPLQWYVEQLLELARAITELAAL